MWFSKASFGCCLHFQWSRLHRWRNISNFSRLKLNTLERSLHKSLATKFLPISGVSNVDILCHILMCSLSKSFDQKCFPHCQSFQGILHLVCVWDPSSWVGVERLRSFRGRPSYKQQCGGWQEETPRTRRQGPSWFLPPRHHLQVGVRTCQEQGGAVRGWKLVSCQDFKDSEGSEDKNEAKRTSC